MLATPDHSVTPPTGLTYNYLMKEESVEDLRAKEKSRLLLQHLILKHVFNGIVLCPVNLSDGSTKRIMDSGTGSGSWLEDVASQVSGSVTLEGIDPDPRLFPSPRLEGSVLTRYHQLGIQDLPAEWDNSFDLIHQRLLIAALTEDGWSKSLSAIWNALKPGGWVQLTEAGGPKTTHLEGSKSERIFSILNELFRRTNHLLNCSQEIPRFLDEAQFTNVKVIKTVIPLCGEKGGPGKEGTGGGDGSENFIGVFKLMKGGAVKLPSVGSEEAYDKLLEEVAAEWADPVNDAHLEFFTFIAQKPKD